MALTLGDAILYLRGDSSGLDKDLDGATKKTEGWANKLGGSVGKLVGGVVVAGAAAAVAGVAAIGSAAFGAANELQTATQNIQADLNLTADEAKKLGQIGLDVFGNNFADSITDAAESVGIVRKQMQGLNDEDLQDATENALRLRDAWGVDVSEGVDAAKTLMDNFGLSQQEAFDLLASGYQQGLDRSGDFLDSVNEYSTQFASGGASVESFFGLMQSGLAGGMLGTDKAADAFKEFRVRIQDGSKTTAEGLAMLGDTGEFMAKGLADGTLTAANAFSIMQTELYKIDDPVKRMQAGVALMGTQFEDLGDAALNLELIEDNFLNVAGSINAVDARYKTFGSTVEGYKREFIVALTPLGDKLLGLANDALPYVATGMQMVIDGLVPLIDWLIKAGEGIGGLVAWFKDKLPTSIDTSAGALGVVTTWFRDNLPLMRKTVETVLGAISAFWENHGAKIMRIVDAMWTVVKTIWDTALKNILDVFTLVMQLITGDLEGAGETIKGIFKRTVDAVFTIWDTWLGTLWDTVTEIDWGALGLSIVQGIANGLAGAGHLLVSAAQGAAGAAVDGIKGLLGIHSPSRVMAAQVGLPMAQGVMEGLGQGLEEMRLNLAPMMMAGAGGRAGDTFNINFGQTFNGAADPGQVQRAARAGVDSVLQLRRQRGY